MKSYFKDIAIVLVFSFSYIFSQAQEKKDASSDPTGFLSMGARSCISIFTTNGKEFVGTGVGGQFALQIAKNFNSHWFADWITSNINNRAQRVDFHSGFSMMPQIFSKPIGTTSISLFPLAGFCIDYTKFTITTGKNTSSGPNHIDRYSFAAQAGCGATIPVSERLNVSLETHYMLHIGTDVDIAMSGDDVRLVKQKGSNLEGHFILALSIDYKLFKLWQKKSS